jgi:hypothetical protein
MAISTDRWRELMGADAAGLTDAEVEQDRDEFVRAGRVFLSVYDERRRAAQDEPAGQVSERAAR